MKGFLPNALSARPATCGPRKAGRFRRLRRQIPHDRILPDAVGSEVGITKVPFGAVEGDLGYEPKTAQTRRVEPNTMAEESEPAVGVVVEGGLDGTAVARNHSPAAPLLCLDVKL